MKTSDKEFKEFEKIKICPSCNSERIRFYMGKTVWKCEHCGLLFRNPRPTQEEIRKSYDSDVTFTKWETQFEARQKTWERRISIIKRLGGGKKILDIGVGDGHFLTVAQANGYICEGTEFSNAGKARAESRGFEIHYGQLIDLQLPEKSYDVVTMWHVFEHVPDPGSVLREIHRILKPNGMTFIAVPNEEKMLFRHRLFRKTGNPLGEPEWGHEIHLNHFKPKTLRRAFRDSGFEVVYFGVDDIYHVRSLRNLLVIFMHNILNAVFKWHFSKAMLCVGRKGSEKQRFLRENL